MVLTANQCSLAVSSVVESHSLKFELQFARFFSNLNPSDSTLAVLWQSPGSCHVVPWQFSGSSLGSSSPLWSSGKVPGSPQADVRQMSESFYLMKDQCEKNHA